MAITPTSKLMIEGIEGFFIREVKAIGNSAYVGVPKEYMGREVWVVVGHTRRTVPRLKKRNSK